MKNLLYYVGISISVLMLSCGPGSVDLAIDNPTEFPVEVSVDTLHVEIPAKQVVWVEMGKGEHKITLDNDSIINYNFTERAYLVNPTKATYLLMEEYYGPPQYQDTYTHVLPTKKVDFYGTELEGNFGAVSDVITKVTWDYGARELTPEMVEVDDGSNYTVLVKLFDPHEVYEMSQN